MYAFSLQFQTTPPLSMAEQLNLAVIREVYHMMTVHFAVSHFAVSHYRTLTLTLTLPLGSGKRQNRKRRNGKSRIRFVVATHTPRSSHISNARFTRNLLLASSLAAGRRSAPRDRYTAICYCASIRC